MEKTKRQRRPAQGRKRSAPDERPAFDSALASTRFIRNMVWTVTICGLFLTGQLIRSGYVAAQLDEVEARTEALYRSALGPDIGSSPFGRLQFEHGKLAAEARIGLDPLSVLAVLSRSADPNLRIESVTLKGKTGRIEGFFGPNADGFDDYYAALAEDERFLFSLEEREDVFGGLMFTLGVEPL